MTLSKKNELLREIIAEDRAVERDAEAAYSDQGAYGRTIARKMRLKYPKIFETQETLRYAVEEVNYELESGAENTEELYDQVLSEIYDENSWVSPGPSEAEVMEQVARNETSATIEEMRQERDRIRGNVL